MLKPYDHSENQLAETFRDRKSLHSICYASELMERFDLSEAEMNEAIERAFRACSSLRIPIRDNFFSVYRSAEQHAITDWRLSPLAAYLLIINADPGKAEIAYLQITFAAKKFNDVTIF